MSVILDALRRSRGRTSSPQTPPRSAASGVPAALWDRSARGSRTPARRRSRWPLLAIALLVGAAAVAFRVLYTPQQRVAERGASVPSTQEVPVSPATSAPAADRMSNASARDASAARDSAPLAGDSAFDAPESRTLPATIGDEGAAPASSRAPARAARRRPAPRPLPAAPVPALTAPATEAAAPPANVDHFKLALYYHRLGDFDQALRHYRALLDANEFNIEARNNLALLYQDKGLYGEAVREFRRALLIDPRYLKARNNLGVALTRAGKLDEAMTEFRALLAQDSKNVDALVNLALAQKAAGRGEQATETLIKAVGYNPSHPVSHYNLALLYDDAGMFAKAFDHYNAFLSHAGPEHASVLADVRRRVDALAAKLTALKQP